MADWPDAAQLKLRVDVPSDDHDVELDRIVAAAIKRVKLDVGDWDEDEDVPDESLSQAALRMAELIAERPDATPGRFTVPGRFKDPTYSLLMFGKRRRFGVA
jgi:hypothetical protein